MPGKLDLCGQKFHRLTALNYVGRKKGRRQWRFKCECGNEIEVYGSSVKRGNTKSCGCLQRDSLKITHKNNIKDGTSPRRLLHNYKRGAIKRGLCFKLSDATFYRLIQGICFYCGNSPSQLENTKDRLHLPYYYNGVDRVDNAIGYIKNNCVTCCKLCNAMKERLSQEVFYNHIKKIANYSKV